MSEVSTDRAENLKWIARKGDTQSLRINFSGDVTDVSDREFEITILRYGNVVAVTLSEDNGKIVNSGSYITVTLDGTNSDIAADTYKWKLRDDTDFTWFVAPFVMNDDPNTPASSSASVDVSIGDNVVNLDITIAPADHYRGLYASLVALQSAIPTGNPGDYADVDAGVGTDIQRYIWDEDEEWVLGGGSGSFADLSGVPSDNAALAAALDAKQATLVSGTNIKTINSTSLLGSGDVVIGGATEATLAEALAGTDTATRMSPRRTRNVTGRVYNVEAYGAVHDGSTDDTVAIQSAINAAFAAGGGRVYLPVGIYKIAGALQTNVGGVNPNCQIYIPSKVTATYASIPEIIIEGEAPPTRYISFGYAWTSGVILKSTISGSGTIPAVIGGRGIDTTFNLTSLTMRNITIQTYTNSGTQPTSMTALNGGDIATLSAYNCYFTLDAPVNLSAVNPNANEVAGAILSKTLNNGPDVFEGCFAAGYKYGFIVSGDHTVMTQCWAQNNIRGFVFPACFNDIIINGGTAQCNVTNLWFPDSTVMGQANGNTFVDINMQIEQNVACNGAWYAVVNDIVDVNSNAFGTLRYKKQAGVALIYTSTENLNLNKMGWETWLPVQVNQAGGVINRVSGTTAGSINAPVLELGNNVAASTDTNYPVLRLTTKQSGTANSLGVIQVVNSALGVVGTSSEKRMWQLSIATNGATNTGQINEFLLNAGTLTQISNKTPTSIRHAVNTYIGGTGTAPTAKLHLAAGSATADTAPIKFTTGTVTTAAVAGQMEYNNTFHLTNSDATRRHIVLAAASTKTTAGAPYTNDGYVTINIGGTDVKVMTTA